MRILIGQPIHEKGIEQLEGEIKANKEIDIVLYPEGYLSSEEVLENACEIAKKHNVTIITSYRQENKDRAVIISNKGEKVFDRAKTPPAENIKLYPPLTVEYNEMTIGYLLCMEILKGVRDFKEINDSIDFICHPIGVGMFSDEQFEEWINEAKKIAKAYKAIIVGTSHADGSYRNCGISIPISYCIDRNGEDILISKSDTKTRIVDLNTREVEFSALTAL
jgi:predicted amidohydrolase